MCNLYSNLTTHEAMRQLFDVDLENSLLPADWQPAARLYPKSRAAIVHLNEGKPSLREMQWGFLLPQQSKRTGKPILPRAVTNARSDKVTTSPFWRDSLRMRRCLVPSTAYCEAVGRSPAVKHWFAYTPNGGDPEPFGFAGLWTVFNGLIRGEVQRIVTFAIATTDANSFVSGYHHRMPVILSREDYGRWLHGSVEDAAGLLAPVPDGSVSLLPSGSGPAPEMADEVLF